MHICYFVCFVFFLNENPEIQYGYFNGDGPILSCLSFLIEKTSKFLTFVHWIEIKKKKKPSKPKTQAKQLIFFY